MMTTTLSAGTGSSVVVDRCQVCDSTELEPLLFLGYLPPVNQMRTIGAKPAEEAAYPAQWLRCQKCELVQIGLIVDPQILFPPEYPYTSGTTRILRENFAELYRECAGVIPLKAQDLIVDIGSNDGTLLSNFRDAGHRVHGIEPTDRGNLANERGIKTTIAFFDQAVAQRVSKENGLATVITATNVFAHIENIHQILDAIATMIDEKGIFVTESHYLLGLIETLQYDTIYHEHLRYYSLKSLQYLLAMHGFEVLHAKRIPTHGGSIRVYASRKGVHKIRDSVIEVLAQESPESLGMARFAQFSHDVLMSKLKLYRLLEDIKAKKHRIYGIGAPSRASTLIHYIGLDETILDCVLEVKDSFKVGKYMPGTLIPVLDEAKLFEDQPEYALLLSWHIGEELAPKLREKGFKGKYIVPLPVPRIIDGK